MAKPKKRRDANELPRNVVKKVTDPSAAEEFRIPFGYQEVSRGRRALSTWCEERREGEGGEAHGRGVPEFARMAANTVAFLVRAHGGIRVNSLGIGCDPTPLANLQ